MYFETITEFKKMLNNLNKILDKAAQQAEAKKFDLPTLLNFRLYPDQFGFIRQIQIACDSAKVAAAKLAGKEAPKHDDNETTVSDLKNRIASTVSYLESLTASDFEATPTRKITLPRQEGKFLTAVDFLQQHSIPNFYFHVTTAYAILRHNGIEVGKKDYLGERNFRPLD